MSARILVIEDDENLRLGLRDNLEAQGWEVREAADGERGLELALEWQADLILLGGKVVTLSDSGGYIHDPEGISTEKLEYLKELKEVKRGRIKEYAEKFRSAEFHKGRPWNVPVKIALPCATQNEIALEDAQTLLKNGLVAVSEGANMPSEQAAIDAFLHAKIDFGPGKAANAGGVAVSGLEQSQNALRLSWSRKEIDEKLQTIMQDIHKKCLQYGKENDFNNYVKGANIGGFIKVADAMLAYGAV